jgi:hypothetical protein
MSAGPVLARTLLAKYSDGHTPGYVDEGVPDGDGTVRDEDGTARHADEAFAMATGLFERDGTVREGRAPFTIGRTVHDGTGPLAMVTGAVAIRVGG